MKKIFLLMVGLVFGYTVAAQTVVTGRVVDEYQRPLIGANVLVPGTTQGTSTDVDGAFSIQVGKGVNEVLVSFLNYKSVTKQLNPSATRQDLGVIQLIFFFNLI